MTFGYLISQPRPAAPKVLARGGYKWRDTGGRLWITGWTDPKLARLEADKVALDRVVADVVVLDGSPVACFQRRVWTRWGEDTTPRPDNAYSDETPKHRGWTRPYPAPAGAALEERTPAAPQEQL